MNAEFVVGERSEAEVHVSAVNLDRPRVYLKIAYLHKGESVLLPLKKSEARAIASALMGAAAEL